MAAGCQQVLAFRKTMDNNWAYEFGSLLFLNSFSNIKFERTCSSKVGHSLSVNLVLLDFHIVLQMMNQFVEDSSSEDSEEEDPDIWSKNNNKVVSSYIRKIAEPGTGPRFDLSKSLLRLDRRHNVMKHMVKSMSRKDIQWVRDNFMSVFCKVCVINEETGRCYCGRHPQEHRQIPHSIREGEESLTEWSKESCLAKESTDGLGRLLFDDDDHFASR